MNTDTHPTIVVRKGPGGSHVDHAMTPAQRDWLIARAAEALSPGVRVQSFELPPELGTVPCTLHGPAMGDDPVPDIEVTLRAREGREGESRLCERPPRQVRTATVVVGPDGDDAHVLYTMFGGPSAPREPFELMSSPCVSCGGYGFHGTFAIGGPSPSRCYSCEGGEIPHPDRAKSDAFWAEHALSL